MKKAEVIVFNTSGNCCYGVRRLIASQVRPFTIVEIGEVPEFEAVYEYEYLDITEMCWGDVIRAAHINLAHARTLCDQANDHGKPLEEFDK